LNESEEESYQLCELEEISLEQKSFVHLSFSDNGRPKMQNGKENKNMVSKAMQGNNNTPVSPTNISKYEEPVEELKSIRGKIMAKNDAMKVIFPSPFQTTTKQSNVQHRREKKHRK